MNEKYPRLSAVLHVKDDKLVTNGTWEEGGIADYKTISIDDSSMDKNLNLVGFGSNTYRKLATNLPH